MSTNLIQILNKGTKHDILSLIESMPDKEILGICLNPENFMIYRTKTFNP